MPLRARMLRPELPLVVLAVAACGGASAPQNGPIVASRSDGIYLLDPENGSARKVPGLTEFHHAAVSAEGTSLALSDGVDLYVADLDGTDVRRVIRNGTAPSWSPDGKQLVFVRDACFDRGQECDLAFDHPAELAMVDVDGSRLRRLTFDTVYQADPDWSPDGERIAYEGDEGVYVMDADGDNPRLVARSVTGPRWSPDGGRLVVAGALTRPAASLLVIDLESGNGTRLRTPLGPLYWPDWSPDGRAIVYGGLRVRGWTADQPLQVWVMGADGRDARPVTRTLGWSIPTWAARD